MHFFLVHTVISVLIKKQIQSISRPGDGVGCWHCLPKAKLPPEEYKVRYFTEGQGLKPGHILLILFALQPQR